MRDKQTGESQVEAGEGEQGTSLSPRFIRALLKICHRLCGTTKGSVQSVLAATFYGVCSVSVAFTNKLLMTTYEFDYPVFIMTVQMLFTITILEILSLCGMISLPRYSLERGKMFALPAFFYGVNSILALSALSNMNLALYGILKRCVPVVTMVMSVVMLKKGWPSWLTGVSVILLTLGCVVAGYGDMTFNVLGYACGALSNIFQAAYLLLVQKATEGKLTMVETLQLNSINTLPFLAITCYLKGELSHIKEIQNYSDVSFIVVFMLTIILGCLLNYSLFLCTSQTSALTTSVVGGMKALAQTVIGIFTFGGVSKNVWTGLGILMSMTGSFGYVFSKFKDMKKEKQPVDLRKVMSFSTPGDFKLKNGLEINGIETKAKQLLNGGP